MKSHMMSYTRNSLPFKCPVCPKDFLQFSNLKEHMRIHPEFKPFECQLCKERFSKNCDLSTHMLAHEKSLVSLSDLRSEKKKKINKNKQYVCTICGQKFRDKSCRNVHMRHHNGERVIDCDFCRRKFTTKGYLARHMIIHSKSVAEHSCQICRQSFLRIVTLKRHMDECHSGELSIDESLICEKEDWIEKIRFTSKVDIENKNSVVLEEVSLKNIRESENSILLSMENEPCEQPLDLSLQTGI
ncbi:gastrula zinc finger protein XlCGF71.1-like [Belonocnema kinseyi]|uniref:gastrula zinc finger protein XlCGF71.1-like n=1 Tax=Belonocnema kinseyi TaxID=2817044 RepID=UPI00143D000B|nr:gastrula zinc finger protein XlCGF71.1-like [Belonocnema kinseyi]